METIIQATCDNRYELFVDGNRIGFAGNWRKIAEHRIDLSPGSHTIEFKCTNFGGPAAFMSTIRYGESMDQTDQTWQVSEDGNKWAPVKVIGPRDCSPWGKAVGEIEGNPSWVWSSTLEKRQTVYIKKSISIEVPARPSNAGSPSAPNSESSPVTTPRTEDSAPESVSDPRLIDLTSWSRLNEKIKGTIEESMDHTELMIGFEKFITPEDPAVKAKVAELGNDPVRCYRYVSDTIKYVSDRDNYLKDEYWCYPKETLTKGSGDCEDMAFLMSSMFSVLGIESFVRMAFLIQYGGGHAWCYFKLNGQWVPAECTSSGFNPWGGSTKWPYYGPYIPWVDVKIQNSHDYSGTELLKHALRVRIGDYSDGQVKLSDALIKNRMIIQKDTPV